MNKRQLIDDIRRINVTVQPQFLAQFDDDWGAADTIRATLAPFRSRT